LDFFRKKEVVPDKVEMARRLNSMDVILLGLGATVGIGIFATTGIGIATVAGPALIISTILAAVIVGMSSLIFSEFASRLGNQSGPYGYISIIFGELPGWIAGCLLSINFIRWIALAASAWSSYLKGVFNLHLPSVINGALGTSSGFSIDLLSVIMVIFVMVLVLMNASTVLRFNNILVILKFSAIILFIVVGTFYLNPSNWSNFAPFGWGHIGGRDIGILPGTALMFLAFIGFETIPSAVNEVKNPQKSIPAGVIGSLIVSSVFYILVIFVLTGITNYKNLNHDDTLAYALRLTGAHAPAIYVSLIAVITLVTVCIVPMFAMSRMVKGLSKDGLLIPSLTKVSKVRKVPINATYLTGIIAAITVALFPTNMLLDFGNFCMIIYLMMLALGILKLRHHYGLPQKGEFRTPFVPVLPIISLLLSLILLAQYPLSIWLTFIPAMVIVLLIYFIYGYNHSILNTNKKTVR